MGLELKLVDLKSNAEYNVLCIGSSKSVTFRINNKKVIVEGFNIIVDKDCSSLSEGDGVQLYANSGYHKIFKIKEINYSTRTLTINRTKIYNGQGMCGHKCKCHNKSECETKKDNVLTYRDILDNPDFKKKHLIIAGSDGVKLTNIYEFKDGKLINKSFSRCHDEDTFSFHEGVNIAFNRLIGKEIKNPRVKTDFRYITTNKPVYTGDQITVGTSKGVYIGKLSQYSDDVFDIIGEDGRAIGQIAYGDPVIILKSLDIFK